MIGRRLNALSTSGIGQLCIALACVLSLALARASEGPELYLSLQGVTDDTIGQGEPLRVSVLIEAPDGVTDPYLLAPASGTWADAVAVEILAADGDTVVASAQAVGQPDESTATVDSERIAGGLWRFPAEVVQPLQPGAYQLRATLKISDGPGWRGTAASDDLPLTVLPPSDDPARADIKALAFARDALLSGDPETAAQTLDVQLAGDPSNFRLLLLRAKVAEQAGNLPAAQMLLNLAHLGNPDNPGSYPNPDFEETSGHVMAGLLSGPTGSAPSGLPAWSWPPESVLRALAERMPAEATTEEELTAPASADPASASADTPVSAPAVVAEPATQATPATTATDSIKADADAPRYWLGDQAVPASSNGQWAVSAVAGSQYGDIERSASRATGAPDVPGSDDHPNAWCPATRDSGSDWLELTFEKAAPATEVRVRQNYGPGAIVKVEAIEPGGEANTWWEGVDPYGQDGFADDAVWFSVRVPPTGYDVQKIRLTLNLGAHGRWKQIDAVQLIGAPAH